MVWSIVLGHWCESLIVSLLKQITVTLAIARNYCLGLSG